MQEITRKLPALIGGLHAAVYVRFSVSKPWSVELAAPTVKVFVSREALYRGLSEDWGTRHVRIRPDDHTIRIHIGVLTKDNTPSVMTAAVSKSALAAALGEMERMLPYGRERLNWVMSMQDLTETYAAYLSREFPS